MALCIAIRGWLPESEAMLRVEICGHALTGTTEKCCGFVVLSKSSNVGPAVAVSEKCWIRLQRDSAGVSDEPLGGVRVACVEVIFEHIAALAAQ